MSYSVTAADLKYYTDLFKCSSSVHLSYEALLRNIYIMAIVTKRVLNAPKIKKIRVHKMHF